MNFLMWRAETPALPQVVTPTLPSGQGRPPYRKSGRPPYHPGRDARLTGKSGRPAPLFPTSLNPFNPL
ncbi:MAG: hypothetical protein FJY65_10730 [Calditrichaeota bacterium]|nr:hypothetical protein [Calditrichota bacterium]